MKYKYIISNQRPVVSDEMGSEFMDFASVYTRYKTSPAGILHSVKNMISRWLSPSIAIATLGTSLYFLIQKETEVPHGDKPLAKTVHSAESDDQISSDKIEPITDDRNEDNDQTNQPEQPYQMELPGVWRQDVSSAEKIAKTEKLPEKKKEGSPDMMVEESGYFSPTPKDGFPLLYKYYAENMKYPESAVEDSISGKVVVMFMVSKTGKISNITIRQSLGNEFDAEALRLVHGMPPWNPAIMNGTPVDKYVALPITFEFHPSPFTEEE